MSFDRASGILLHPTSLPSRGGIGDFGPAAHAFIDFLHQSKQRLWQILPLSPVGFGYSPYSAISAFAGNPLLISLELLAEQGWITQGQLSSLPSSDGNIDYPSVISAKMPLLQTAAENFLAKASDDHKSRFHSFCSENGWWLEDFVLFNCIREQYGSVGWNRWPRPIARREPAVLEEAKRDLAGALQVERVIQFMFFEQWNALRQRCAEHRIRIIGDVAIFVNFDSADVWTNPDIFQLNAELEPISVSGVPPDAFSATGQRWGNPLYRWDVLKQRGYDWWIRRMKWAVTVCDYVRLDHFRGFEQYWEIPAHEPTAVHGRWVDGPKDDLFHALKNALGDLPFIAEDLGMITREVNELRDRLGMPGMKVLQFAFNNPGAHIYLPHRFDSNCVVYTGTHDNDTTIGWFNSIAEEERRNVLAYTGEPKDGIHWAMIRVAHGSRAAFSIVPMQDVLGLGSDARMNTPSIVTGNWRWRYSADAIVHQLSAKLAGIAEMTDR